MHEEKPINTEAVDAIVRRALQRLQLNLGIALTFSLKALGAMLEFAIWAIVFFGFIGMFWVDATGHPPLTWIPAVALGLVFTLARRHFDWAELWKNRLAPISAIGMFFQTKAFQPMMDWSKPFQSHSVTKWTIAILCYLGGKLWLALRVASRILGSVLSLCGAAIDGLFKAIEELFAWSAAFVGGLLIFAIWLFVLLGIIGILIFGVGQIF
jgi:hypothetical protein